MSKDKKKVIAKRRAQAKAKKPKKSKTKSRSSHSTVQYRDRPAISAMDAPPGFRAVSMSQAMLEYGQPIMEFVGKGVVKDPNTAYQLVALFWNHGLSTEKGILTIEKNQTIRHMKTILKLKSQESAEFFDMMIQRKEHLFPQEIQPDYPMTMFIRNVEHYDIKEFNYGSLNLSNELYLPKDKDHELLKLLNQMDEYVDDGTEYEEWEDHYFVMEEKCSERFADWLEFKGAKEYKEDFSYNATVYLNFIYMFDHQKEITLESVAVIEIAEFFGDYVLRKVMVEPHEYISWLPALKLFYAFLKEIGYLEKPARVTKLIDAMEPVFIKILKARYA
jgi:hypothetical protein